MAIKDKIEASKNMKAIVVIYILLNFFFSNFVMFQVDTDNLVGSISFDFNHSTTGLIISLVIMIGWLYFFLKGYKFASTLIFVGAVMNIIFILMSIETSNFSMYNIFLIMNIIISLGVIFYLRPKI